MTDNEKLARWQGLNTCIHDIKGYYLPKGCVDDYLNDDAAAVKTADGVIHFMPPPNRHHHTVHALHLAFSDDKSGIIQARGEQGFVMSDGTFADREEAAKAALSAGRINSLSHPPKLYSEDLW